MGTLSKIRRASWRVSAIAGDVQAAARGPVPAAKRVVRKRVYCKSGRLTRELLRMLGL